MTTYTDTDKPFHVAITENERGWGSSLEIVKGFDTKELANAYIKQYNSKNTAPITPDYYWLAQPHNY